MLLTDTDFLENISKENLYANVNHTNPQIFQIALSILPNISW